MAKLQKVLTHYFWQKKTVLKDKNRKINKKYDDDFVCKNSMQIKINN